MLSRTTGDTTTSGWSRNTSAEQALLTSCKSVDDAGGGWTNRDGEGGDAGGIQTGGVGGGVEGSDRCQGQWRWRG